MGRFCILRGLALTTGSAETHVPASRDGQTAFTAAGVEAAALVARIRGGESTAEGELVERYGRGVRYLLRQLCGDPAPADDLFQETFRLVLEKVRHGALRQPEALPAFIRSTARNLFIGAYRRDRRQRLDPLDERTVDPGPGPLAMALRRQDGLVVRQLLAELEPPRDREVLFRFYLAEEPKEHICRDLGLSSLQFNRVVHRARKRFKTLIERAGTPVGPFSKSGRRQE